MWRQTVLRRLRVRLNASVSQAFDMLYSTRQQIGDQLRDDILCGKLTDGQRLGEAELARRFAVSRGPIREAIALLTQEGLLEFKPNCGARVAQAAPSFVCELFVPIRRTIETSALKIVFDQLNPADFKAWANILGGMESACRDGDVSGVVRHDLAFHRYLLVRTGQADLIGIWQMIAARIRGRFQQSVLKYGTSLKQFHDEHHALLDIIRNGSFDDAEKSLQSHIE